MALRLRLEDPFVAGGGAVPELVLDRRGAIIGRSPTLDWSLPDPEKIVSSRHCEIDFRGNAYLLVDTSTNGTFVNGGRVDAPRVLANGDVVTIGMYRFTVALDQAAVPQTGGAEGEWAGWDSHVGAAPPGVDPSAWGRPPPAPEISGRGALSRQWSPPEVGAPAPPPGAVKWGAWSAEPAPPAPAASAWSSEPVPLGPPSAPDIWGQVAASNVVDWARGGFGAPAKPVGTADPLGLGLPAAPAAGTPGVVSPPPAAWGASPAAPTSPATPAPSVPVRPGPEGALASAFAAAAGVRREDLPADAELGRDAGALLRRLVAGLVVMMEARTRAKAQMGATRTALQLDGNNPLKFARSPEQAVTQLLRPPERGFMTAERAVEDAFIDLQAHQIATLKAMQGALAATLKRFSPDAIRGRAERKGIVARLLPGAREAALWQAYEREFSGVAKGSDEAFMDVFAKEFCQAYEEAARR